MSPPNVNLVSLILSLNLRSNAVLTTSLAYMKKRCLHFAMKCVQRRQDVNSLRVLPLFRRCAISVSWWSAITGHPCLEFSLQFIKLENWHVQKVSQLTQVPQKKAKKVQQNWKHKSLDSSSNFYLNKLQDPPPQLQLRNKLTNKKKSLAS